jgi:MFS family permease
VTNIAPTIAPVVSGFVSPSGWRWSFWIGLIVAGITLVVLLFLPETYAPVLLKKRARKLRKETGNPQIFAPSELEKRGIYELLSVTLARPFQMVIFEPIVTFTCLYLSLVIAMYCKWL